MPTRWSQKTEAQRARIRECNRKWAKRNRDKQRLQKTMSRHNISGEQYTAMYEAQGGRCAICEQRETKLMNGVPMRLCVDHDHSTDEIRALLCSRCNAVLGLVYDNDQLLEVMAVYLRVHRRE